MIFPGIRIPIIKMKQLSDHLIFIMGTSIPVWWHLYIERAPGSAFIKPDQPGPWIKDQIKIILLSTISPIQLPNFVSCGRDKPSHMTQNFVTGNCRGKIVDSRAFPSWSLIHGSSQSGLIKAEPGPLDVVGLTESILQKQSQDLWILWGPLSQFCRNISS